MSESLLKKKSGRDSNIELLRIIVMLGVIILHYNNPSMGGGLKFASTNTLGYIILLVFESFFICAVNLFVLISGYFLSGTGKRNLLKPLELLVQVVIFSIGLYFVGIIIGNESFSFRSLASKFIPVNWFVLLYVALYIISPYINLIFAHLNKKQTWVFVLVCFVLFVFYPYFIEILVSFTGNPLAGASTIGMYGSGYGYSITQFLFVYILGASLRHADIKEIKASILLIVLLGCVLVYTIISYFYCDKYWNLVWAYNNPLAVLEAVILFLLFRKIKLGENKIINSFSSAGFTVYLLHSELLQFLNIEKYASGNAVALTLHLIISALSIFAVCYIVHVIYSLVMKPIFSFIGKKCKFLSFDIKNELVEQKGKTLE